VQVIEASCIPCNAWFPSFRENSVKHRTASVYRSTKTSRKKYVTKELAAVSGVPPAFQKQLESCCILPHSVTATRVGVIAVRCVTETLRDDGNQA